MFLRGCYMLWKTYFGIRRSQLGFCDKSVSLTPPLMLHNPKNVFLYENTSIRANALISAVNARFIMKKNSGAAEGLMVRTGNHMIVPGKLYKEITDQYKKESGKLSEYDKDVIVEENVWIGCNVTLLSGVIIGRGATIGAGSVVTKPIPPYAIAAGVPCKVIKFRWDIEQIIEHEKILYPENERLTREDLQFYFDKYNKNN